ncbi:MAG: FMN-binding protein [Clostridia bacterium]|nr:FMN-binding protein [Clostridia bacterium]
MKKSILALLFAVLVLACSVAAAAELTTVPYVQYSSGGTATELNAVILFENKNSTFTRYQVAFASCTCRGAESNYRSVMYIELLNKKETADDAKIRSISFSDVKGTTVGMWGDSNPIYMQPDKTFEYMNENFVQKLVGCTKRDIDAWQGYGKVIDAVDADAVSGATVSVSNIISVVRSMFDYHAKKYYKQ